MLCKDRGPSPLDGPDDRLSFASVVILPVVGKAEKQVVWIGAGDAGSNVFGA